MQGVACTGVKIMHKVLGEKPDGKGQLGRQGIERRIRLQWISKKWDGRAWNELPWLVQVADCGELSNEHSGSVKCGQFLD